MKNLTIVSLEIENIKRLVAVHIRPDGKLVEITGNNAQGKTSVMDAIWWGLDGERNIQDDPIRHGEEKALIKLDLGEIIVTRTFTSKPDGTYTTSLKVEAPDGSRYTSPQQMLKELLGNLTFDPLNFMKIKPKAQMEMLKTFVPDIDFEAIDRANEEDYNARQDINRDNKLLVARASGIEIPDDCPDVVDIQGLIKEISAASVHNDGIETRKNNRERDEKTIEDKNSQADEKLSKADNLRDEAKDLDLQAIRLAQEITDMKAALNKSAELLDVIDIEEIQDKLDTATENNELAAKKKQKAELIKEAEGLKEKSEAFTRTIDRRKARTKSAIEQVKMPVKGLSFGEDCILFNDVPFNQSSDAEQLKVSIMMAIAMNPRLRVIRVRDGSLLDEKSMKLLAEIAEKEGYQIWIERVDGTGKIGFVIEDGSLANGK